MKVITDAMYKFQKKHNVTRECVTNCSLYIHMMKLLHPKLIIKAKPVIVLCHDDELAANYFISHCVCYIENGEDCEDKIIEVSYEIQNKAKHKTYIDTWKVFNDNIIKPFYKDKDNVMYCGYNGDKISWKSLLGEFMDMNKASNEINNSNDLVFHNKKIAEAQYKYVFKITSEYIKQEVDKKFNTYKNKLKV
tara:strand:+ start:3948 stop:4523 length:576 start_codon:yes stop_codon:yes gene_type:complete